MKKGYWFLGIVLVLLALPYLVVGINNKDTNMDNVKITPVEHVMSATTEGVIHHYTDLNSMPDVDLSGLEFEKRCNMISECGEPTKIDEPFCIGDYKYQMVVQPRCMIAVNTSTPPDCGYYIRNVLVRGC